MVEGVGVKDEVRVRVWDSVGEGERDPLEDGRKAVSVGVEVSVGKGVGVRVGEGVVEGVVVGEKVGGKGDPLGD